MTRTASVVVIWQIPLRQASASNRLAHRSPRSDRTSIRLKAVLQSDGLGKPSASG